MTLEELALAAQDLADQCSATLVCRGTMLKHSTCLDLQAQEVSRVEPGRHNRLATRHGRRRKTVEEYDPSRLCAACAAWWHLQIAAGCLDGLALTAAMRRAE